MSELIQQEHDLDGVAEEVLQTFQAVASAAHTGQLAGSSLNANSLASVNSFTSGKALQTLDDISSASLDSNSRLQREPAISRVVVEDAEGARRTFYICRTTPLSVSGMQGQLASYRSPVGRLASLPVGETFELPFGVVSILESARLHPFNDGTWDSRNTIVESEDFGPVTVESLRTLLSKEPFALYSDVLDRILAEAGASANVIEGIRRNVITKMGLRDQPVLDKYQDEIFRMPLSSQLLLLGPPGTGKTTTLIRRLGQKLDVEQLEDTEQALVRRLNEAGGAPHAQSWLMFTPTDLLKQYVKEAFAHEGIAASEQRIRTWSDFRRDLGRNELGVLRTNAGSGIFVLKEALESLNVDARNNLTAWFDDFDQWQKAEFLSQIRRAAENLLANTDTSISALAKQPLDAVSSTEVENVDDVVVTLTRASVDLTARIADMKKFTDSKVRDALTLQVNKRNTFLDEFAKFLDTLQEAATVDIEEPDDQDGDEDEEPSEVTTGLAAAMATYQRHVRAQARAHAKKRSQSKGSRNAKIAEWLGDRGLPTKDMIAVGQSLVVQGDIRKLINPAKRYVQGIPRRYRSFRRVRQDEGHWYPNEGFSASDLNPLELDGILLAMLRSGGNLLRRPTVAREVSRPEWSSLTPVRDAMRNQVLVDEATDFSPVQLACMAALANPATRSFFACGDFNQRLTSWGSRKLNEIEWAVPGISTRMINVSYRQSSQLNDLAKALAQVSGDDATGAVLPANVESNGVPPVLAEQLEPGADLIAWLATRIAEIEFQVKQLPSIAVLVMHESEVQPLAEGLNAALQDSNIRAVACMNGQTVGQEIDVRVFDVQHIKGLEFEAVFFVGVDRLADNYPELFDKYLYVGTTRAATYLGMTCESSLPAALNTLRPIFSKHWEGLGGGEMP